MKLTIDTTIMERFEEQLQAEEKSRATIEKYVRDARAFVAFLNGMPITKETVISYKQNLTNDYEPISINSMLASVNCFLRFAGYADCVVRTFKIQKAVFRPKGRELSKKEYVSLVEAARRRGNRRLCLIMQTICATGIRISELQFITVSALHTRRAVVSLKGKTRTVILPLELCQELKRYARECGVETGSVLSFDRIRG